MLITLGLGPTVLVMMRGLSGWTGYLVVLLGGCYSLIHIGISVCFSCCGVVSYLGCLVYLGPIGGLLGSSLWCGLCITLGVSSVFSAPWFTFGASSLLHVLWGYGCCCQ